MKIIYSIFFKTIVIVGFIVAIVSSIVGMGNILGTLEGQHSQYAELHARLDSIESKLESRNTEFDEVMQIIGTQVESWRMDSEALNKYFEPYKRLGR
jgi:hypothetical protein